MNESDLIDCVLKFSCHHTFRCWNLKTDRCDMALYGHTGTVNCLDADADKLVSGAKDCAVKGKQPLIGIHHLYMSKYNHTLSLIEKTKNTLITYFHFPVEKLSFLRSNSYVLS